MRYEEQSWNASHLGHWYREVGRILGGSIFLSILDTRDDLMRRSADIMANRERRVLYLGRLCRAQGERRSVNMIVGRTVLIQKEMSEGILRHLTGQEGEGR